LLLVGLSTYLKTALGRSPYKLDGIVANDPDGLAQLNISDDITVPKAE
jgi:hypothetical protein